MKLIILFFALINYSYSMDFDVEDAEIVQIPKYLLFEEGRTKSFPSVTPSAYDPINKRYYDKVIVGKANKASFLQDYDYYRYVTVYNVISEEEQVAYLPYFEESCHDSSFFMAQWGESRSMKVSLTSTVSAEALGIGGSLAMSIEAGVTFSTSRRVQATLGLHAKHFPYKLSDRYVGITYIQVYTEDENQFGYVTKPGGMDRFKEYPYPFELNNQNVGFAVKREIVKTCDNYDPSSDRVEEGALYIR
ncbi:MAG: hypothetical protein CME67_01200 [Halobacteriovoraceae bacterium]|nr:hypothetical protein [Peredibacter sp.]MBI99819.1 hypothetical protein [Halobacteriovoraceae bacterium]|tara:strand:- start:7286 stop:8026 length:741 start_codon:yes stop_codon:yes gene_type:complete